MSVFNTPLLPQEMEFWQDGTRLAVSDANGDRVMDLPLYTISNVVIDNDAHQKLIVAAYNIGFNDGKKRGADIVKVKIRQMMAELGFPINEV